MEQHYSSPSIQNLAQQIEDLLNWLAMYGQDPEGGVTRLLYTNSWKQGQQALKEKMESIGLDARFDDVGNLYGRLLTTSVSEGSILVGSHVDTVKSGGKYDGAYGIIAGLVALGYLKETFGTPRRNIEIVSLCEEEGSRFPFAFWGSRSITDTISIEQVESYCDPLGVTFKDAMEGNGFGLGRYISPKRNDLLAFIELHIEQGGILEHEQIPVGIVEQIVGLKRLTIECKGEANHAGTTPMAYRKDAIRGASQMIHEVLTYAEKKGAPFVATVGKVEVKPNVANVIPNQVKFSLDIRHPNKKVLDIYNKEIISKMEEISSSIGLNIHIEMQLDVDPIHMNTSLIQRLETICQGQSIPYKNMPSGAGHDSQIFASYCPTSMLFVPSHLGISHSPLEYTAKEDLARGVQVLIEMLYELAYEEETI